MASDRELEIEVVLEPTLSGPWFLWKLRIMPYRNDPNDIGFGFIKKSVWRYDYLPVGKLWKLWHDSSGLRKIL